MRAGLSLRRQRPPGPAPRSLSPRAEGRTAPPGGRAGRARGPAAPPCGGTGTAPAGTERPARPPAPVPLSPGLQHSNLPSPFLLWLPVCPLLQAAAQRLERLGKLAQVTTEPVSSELGKAPVSDQRRSPVSPCPLVLQQKLNPGPGSQHSLVFHSSYHFTISLSKEKLPGAGRR